jgi:hypothetical protein
MRNLAAQGVDTSKFTPAPEVVDELSKSALPRVARAFLAAASVETLLPNSQTGVLEWPFSWTPFRCLFGFKEWQGPLDKFPPWGGDAQHNTTAAGVWQDLVGTDADLTKLTGNPGFAEQDQIGKNWVLAVRDFSLRTGGQSLQATLEAGAVDKISPALVATWPEGCDLGFPSRFGDALTLFPEDAVPSPVAGEIVLRPGLEAMFPVSGVDQDGQVFSPPATALTSDDLNVCTVMIADGLATVVAVGVGATEIHGVGLSIEVTVSAPQLMRLMADLSKLKISRRTAVAAVAMLAAMLMPSWSGDQVVTAPPPAPLAAAVSSALPQPKKSQIYGVDFCLVGHGREVLAVACR